MLMTSICAFNGYYASINFCYEINEEAFMTSAKITKRSKHILLILFLIRLVCHKIIRPAGKIMELTISNKVILLKCYEVKPNYRFNEFDI
jgi:hypothetical protein